MFYLLLLLGFIAMAAGVFVVGFGVPIRETPFGASLLVVGSVAVTGAFILVGLAAAVRELHRVAQALRARMPGGPRPMRPLERKDAERSDGADKRPGPPRLPMPAAPGAESANAMPTKFDAPDTQPLDSGCNPGPEWLRRAMAEIETAPRPVETAPAPPEHYRADEVRRPSDGWPRSGSLPSPQPVVPDMRHAPAVSPQNIFDMMWPSDGRKNEAASEQRSEAAPEPQSRPVEVRLPVPPPPAPPPVRPVRAEPRPLPILKSGVIDEMAYTLFTDGSIEAQMPEGTMRFASIEELRRHIEKNDD